MAVLCGGPSAERGISLNSARSVLDHIRRPGIDVECFYFDRALRALPITQHERVWELYLEFAKGCPVKETAVRVYRRYLKYDPEGVEEYVAFLLGIGRVSEAALKLAELLNRSRASLAVGSTAHGTARGSQTFGHCAFLVRASLPIDDRRTPSKHC